MTPQAESLLEKLILTLVGQREFAAVRLLRGIVTFASEDPRYCEKLVHWTTSISTLDLRELVDALHARTGALPKAGEELVRFNAVHAIDAAALQVFSPDGMTGRTLEGRLFPAKTWDTGWRLSLQADAQGYACFPKKRLNWLEDYETVEAVIYGPGPELVDPRLLDLPPHVVEKFSEVESGHAAIGSHITAQDIADLQKAINHAGMSPNAGIPRGEIGWQGRTVYHGTSKESAMDILTNGIQMSASSIGYFGRGFYMADDLALAVSNYAEASEDGRGSVIKARIHEDAHILDLRNEDDFKEWLRIADKISAPDFDRIARASGIEGVYDRSMGGLAIFNAKMLVDIDLEPIPNLDPEIESPIENFYDGP